MLTRVAFFGGCTLTLIAAWLFRTPPHPDDHFVIWPVLVLGALAMAAAGMWPNLLKGSIVWLAVAVLTIGGMGLGAVFAQRSDICCMFTVSRRHGYPYPWIDQSASYETLTGNAPPATFDSDAVWSLDWPRFVLSVGFWVCSAVASVVLVRASVALSRVKARTAHTEATA